MEARDVERVAAIEAHAFTTPWKADTFRTLLDRRWIRAVGHRDVPGRPALYGTTREFLDYFGLKGLDELPPLSEIRDIEELDPQLDLDDPRGAIAARLPLDDEPGTDSTDTPTDSAANDARGEADDPASSEQPPSGSAHEDTPESIA